MPANFNLLRTSNDAARAWDSGVAAGNANWDRRNALQEQQAVKDAYATAARNPIAGSNALLAAGQPGAAVNALQYMAARDTRQATDAAAPYLAKGDRRGAANAAAPYSADYSDHLSQLDAASLDRQQKLGQYSASVLMAASNLPDPASRRDYINRNAQRLVALGMPQEAVDRYDVNDPLKMRADASQFLSLSDNAGTIKVEKFGDNAVTYQTDPVRGTREIARTPIPPTRAEQRLLDQADETRRYHDETLALRREEAGRREESLTPSKVVGELYAKMQRGETLTKGEQAVLDHYSTGKMNPLVARALDGSLGGDNAEDDAFASPPPQPGVQPRRPVSAAPAAAASSPERPPAQALARLQEGKPLTFNNGQTWTLKNGKPTRLR